jgi:general L-amino acid transport system substrate-binding protein
MKKTLLSLIIGSAALALGVSSASASTLDDVKAKGFVQCGVNGANLAGFGAQDSAGKWSGLDVDLCKAVAAAVFGDVDKVKYTPLSAKDRSASSSAPSTIMTAKASWSTRASA